MKKSSKCLKCNSDKVIPYKNKTTAYSSLSNGINLNAFKYIVSTKYLCCECGYFEEYIEDNEVLNDLYNKFKK